MSHVIGPGRAYTVCFGGISTEDAQCRVGRQVFVFRPHDDNSGRLGRGDMMETFGTSLGGFPTLSPFGGSAPLTYFPTHAVALLRLLHASPPLPDS